DRLIIGRGVTTASGTVTIPVTYSRMNPQDRVCLKRNGSAVDSTIKLDSQGPDASGCWQRTLPSGTQTLNFTATTLAWVDGSYNFEVTIPADYPEVGSATATITSTNPPLGVTASGISENEQVSGSRQVTIGAQIASVHTSQIKPSKYCVDFNSQACAFTSTTDAASSTYTLVSHAYPDGPHRLVFKATDSAGRESSRAVTFQIANGKPAVSGGTATTQAPTSPNGKASATVSFNAPKSTAATVELTEGKGRPQRADVDLLSSLDGSATASFEGLKPSTKYSFKITSRNANGESRAVTGTFTTPAAPKPAPRAGSSSSAGSGGSSTISCPIVIYVRLDRAESALRSAGCSPYSVPASGCEAFFGIVRKSNWVVVGQRGSTLYACQR
ncbi:MAG: fibronectin type III domain-containing protein, partial [Actinomycetota bacterium]